jgi:hypothetical protein
MAPILAQVDGYAIRSGKFSYDSGGNRIRLRFSTGLANCGDVIYVNP